MKMLAVTSSSIGAVGYEGTTLRIRFKAGKTYDYAGVPADLWDRLQKAESIGIFFGKEVLRKFPFVVVDEKG